MDYVGIDLHKTSSQICALGEGGELTERRIKTTGAAFAEVFANRPRAGILVEASTESEWVACHLEGLGHEVIVADPNFAPMYSTRDKRIKTDKRDARASTRGPGSGSASARRSNASTSLSQCCTSNLMLGGTSSIRLRASRP